jgi:TonB family protein
LQKYRCLWAVLLFFVAIGCAGRCSAQEEQSHVSLTPEQQGGVTAFAQTIQKELKKEKCANSSCQVLVVNLTISTGETCSACILLSDSLAKSLAELPNAPGVVSRASLASFMDQERISSVFLNRQDTQVWVARELRANRLVFGTLVRKGDSLQLKTKVLKHENFGNSTETSKEMRIEIPVGNLSGGFVARESYQALPKRDPSHFDAEATEPSSFKRQGIEPPRCSYMPNPEFTDGARAVKLNGNLIVDAIVTKQGTVEEARISRGLPYGLNQNSLKTLKNWKCEPATKNGVPLAVVVPFEVSFRLY